MVGKVDIVIVSWNSSALTIRALEALAKTAQLSGVLSRVIVVDNGSRPEEIELLKAAADGGLGLPLEMKFN